MHVVAADFISSDEARIALHDLEVQGIPPDTMSVIEPTDKKGFAREHKSNGTAALQGAAVGAVFGIVVLGTLLWIAGANLFTLRYIALYVGGIAICTSGGAIISACWNMGAPHEEARLYEEAREKSQVIAAVEVVDETEQQVIHELERHGARNIRSGDWRPRGWKHTNPYYTTGV